MDSRGVLESRWANFLVLNAHVILQALISSALCQWVFESTFPTPASESQLLSEKFREFVQTTSEPEQEHHRYYAVIANPGQVMHRFCGVLTLRHIKLLLRTNAPKCNSSLRPLEFLHTSFHELLLPYSPQACPL